MLTSLGTNPSDTVYTLDGREHASNVAAAALYALLPEAERPERIIVLCTQQAEEVSLPHLRRALDGQPCSIEVARVSEENTEEAVHQFLATLVDSVPPNVDLTVDVTQGFRHQAFLTYTGVLYLTALRNINLRAAYYGMFATSVSRFVNIGPLVELPRWFHALRVLEDSGNAHLVAKLVAESGPEAAEVSESLELVAEAHSSGLPIELGYTAAQFLDQHEAGLRELLRQRSLPLADTLVDTLVSKLNDQRLTTVPPDSDWKKRLRLDQDELARQVRIINGYLDRQDYATAFGLMREWLVLWDMVRTHRAAEWLKDGGREPNEDRLYLIEQSAHRPDAPPTSETVVGRVWRDLRQLRNAYQHHAIDDGVRLTADPEHTRRIKAVVQVWQVLQKVPEVTLAVPVPTGRALVSPIGMRPGVLFSALRAAGPDQLSCVLVICSADTERAIDEAVGKAGYRGRIVRLRLEDPFAGVVELNDLVRAANHHLAEIGTVLVNITGGTTLMGVLAERIAGRARRGRRRSVHRFALIDRRPVTEQENDPYQVGQACWLDDPPNEAA
jgi:CRISPR-associated protein (cas_TM1812).